MKKISLLLALCLLLCLCACGKTEQPAKTTEDEPPVTQQEAQPPVAEAQRGLLADGKFYSVDGYVSLNIFDGWQLKLVYDYCSRFVSNKSGDYMTLTHSYNPENADDYNDITQEKTAENFSNAYEEAAIVSFEKSEDDVSKRVATVCSVSENETSYTVYEYMFYINTNIYTVSYYVYGEELTDEAVKENIKSFTYLG